MPRNFFCKFIFGLWCFIQRKGPWIEMGPGTEWVGSYIQLRNLGWPLIQELWLLCTGHTTWPNPNPATRNFEHAFLLHNWHFWKMHEMGTQSDISSSRCCMFWLKDVGFTPAMKVKLNWESKWFKCWNWLVKICNIKFGMQRCQLVEQTSHVLMLSPSSHWL